MADPTVQHFLQGPNLRKVFAHLCNNATGQVTDPIAYVVHIMLTCPVQMVVSEVGVALFKDHPNALYPFTAMDMGQRLYVEGVVTSCMDWRSKRAATAVPSVGVGEGGGKGASIQPGRSCNVVMQMGGGCILHIASGGGGRKGGGVLLGAREVMEALCDCIFSSRRYGSARVRHAVCSIVMQRVVGMTGAGGGMAGAVVGREEQQAAYAYAMGKLRREEKEEEEDKEKGGGGGARNVGK